MTLLELLLASALLVGVAAGAASWLSVAAGVAARGEGSARWVIGAAESLRLIADDLGTGDHHLAAARAEPLAGGLAVVTRGRHTDGVRGPMLAVYRVEGGALVREEHRWRGSLTPSSPARRVRTLLEGVGELESALDAEFRVLTVTVRAAAGAGAGAGAGAASRRFILR